MAAGIVYVSPATIAALAEVRAIRATGVRAYATIDAGPHLKCIVKAADAAVVRGRLSSVPGVLRIIEAAPGEGARIVAPQGDGDHKGGGRRGSSPRESSSSPARTPCSKARRRSS
jgi:hypothetical protein